MPSRCLVISSQFGEGGAITTSGSVYIFVVYETGRKREKEKKGEKVEELSSRDSFSIQSTHRRTISGLIKQTERERGRRREEKTPGKMTGLKRK